MNLLNPVIYSPLRSQRSFSATFDGITVHISSDDRAPFSAVVETNGTQLRLKTLNDRNVSNSSLGLDIALEYLFGHFPSVQEAIIGNGNESGQPSQSNVISRRAFFQRPDLWLHDSDMEPKTFSETFTETNGRKHPVRPATRTSTYYKRYVPNIQKRLSLRTVEVDRDLPVFHAWHNQPRVAALWELDKPIDELKAYLEKGLLDPHSIPMIVEFDGEPVGYFEIYWTAEDRLGPYYEYAPYDRGFHFLIGEEKFLGNANTDAVLRSVTHFLFIDDLRTNKILGEPRADNKRVLKYVESVPGWRFIKEFDFPHKRAALVAVERDAFFGAAAL